MAGAFQPALPAVSAASPAAALLQSVQRLPDGDAPVTVASSLVITSMSCQLPRGLTTLGALAHAITVSKDMAATVPAMRWDAAERPSGLETSVMDRTRHGAFIFGAEAFDS